MWSLNWIWICHSPNKIKIHWQTKAREISTMGHVSAHVYKPATPYSFENLTRKTTIKKPPNNKTPLLKKKKKYWATASTNFKTYLMYPDLDTVNYEVILSKEATHYCIIYSCKQIPDPQTTPLYPTAGSAFHPCCSSEQKTHWIKGKLKLTMQLK